MARPEEPAHTILTVCTRIILGCVFAAAIAPAAFGESNFAEMIAKNSCFAANGKFLSAVGLRAPGMLEEDVYICLKPACIHFLAHAHTVSCWILGRLYLGDHDLDVLMVWVVT